MRNFLLVGGVEFEVDFDVVHDPRLIWTPQNTRIYKRTEAPTKVVGHDTAGEGSARGTFNVLRRKRLSVEGQINRRGVFTQYVDFGIWRCTHVNRIVSASSIAVEMANAVFPPGVRPGFFASIRRYALTGRERVYGRPMTVDTYRGKKRRVLGHVPKQIETFYKFTRWCAHHWLTIPWTWPGYPGKFLAERVDPHSKGVFGHLNFSDKHVDPAIDLFDMIRDRGLE